MVQLMKSNDLKHQRQTTPFTEKVPSVKLEIEDSFEEERGPLTKRTKPSPSLNKVVSKSARKVYEETVIFFILL